MSSLAHIAAAQVGPDRYVIKASGHVDRDCVDQLRDALLPVVGADGAHVLLDLGDAVRIDRASLQVIASAARISRRRGDGLGVVTRDPTLETRLAATGAEGLVNFHESVRGWFSQ